MDVLIGFIGGFMVGVATVCTYAALHIRHQVQLEQENEDE